MVRLVRPREDSDEDLVDEIAEVPEKRRLSRIRPANDESDSEIGFTSINRRKKSQESSESSSLESVKMKKPKRAKCAKTAAAFFGETNGDSEEEYADYEDSGSKSSSDNDSFVVDDEEEEDAYNNADDSTEEESSVAKKSKKEKRKSLSSKNQKKKKTNRKMSSSSSSSSDSSSSDENDTSSSSDSSSSSSSSSDLGFHARFIRGIASSDRRLSNVGEEGGEVDDDLIGVIGIGSSNVNREQAFRRFVEAIALSLLSPTGNVFDSPPNFLASGDVKDPLSYYRPAWDRIVNHFATQVISLNASSIWSTEKVTLFRRFPSCSYRHGYTSGCKCFLCGKGVSFTLVLSGVPMDSEYLWKTGFVGDFMTTRRLSFLGKLPEGCANASTLKIMKMSRRQIKVFREAAKLDALKDGEGKLYDSNALKDVFESDEDDDDDIQDSEEENSEKSETTSSEDEEDDIEIDYGTKKKNLVGSSDLKHSSVEDQQAAVDNLFDDQTVAKETSQTPKKSTIEPQPPSIISSSASLKTRKLIRHSSSSLSSSTSDSTRNSSSSVQITGMEKEESFPSTPSQQKTKSQPPLSVNDKAKQLVMMTPSAHQSSSNRPKSDIRSFFSAATTPNKQQSDKSSSSAGKNFFQNVKKTPVTPSQLISMASQREEKFQNLLVKQQDESQAQKQRPSMPRRCPSSTSSISSEGIPSMQGLRSTPGVPDIALVQKVLKKEGKPSSWLDAISARSTIICRRSHLEIEAGPTCASRVSSFINMWGGMTNLIFNVYKCLEQVEEDIRFNDPLTAARKTRKQASSWFSEWESLLDTTHLMAR